ncbi:MAG: hypothetical protein Fur0037_22670 [Planctomycetota bacterium]
MPSPLRLAAAALRVPGNEIAFRARSLLRWRKGTVELPSEPKDALYDHLDPAARERALDRERELRARYDLRALRARSTRLVYAENLSLLDGLERLCAGIPIPCRCGAVSALDVGSGDFRYATALQRWLARHFARRPRAVDLLGVEIDGHGIYRDGSSRIDHARAHAALASSSVRYEVADVSDLGERGTRHVVTLFYPFLSAYALLRWGLPIEHFRPRRLLRASLAALRPGCHLVVANQTGREFDRLRRLLAGEPAVLVRAISWSDPFLPYAERTRDRMASIWARQ